jgi:alkanesulfonate monooxygenase SsuD/methylene tetrahydromethanopterin reductase-like flavin-dependent oxidoreductase (luciferase family)
MKYGYYAPNVGCCGDAAVLADLAAESETSGWDGFFIWDHMQWPGMEPAVDPWVALAAIALRTEKIAIGPLITPLPRRDIAKLARETVSIDRLSGGRLILGVGLGHEGFPEWSGFGHEQNARTRGAMLDEGLGVLDALWSGKAVNHQGPHYKCICDGFAPPVQKPRIPVWIAGLWPGTKPFRRAAKWDGVTPMSKTALEGGPLSPDDITDIKNFIRSEGNSRDDFDIVTYGSTAGPGDTSVVSEYAAAGATWWVEMAATFEPTLDQISTRIRQGPPKV